jgi:hypothetical protein
MRRESSADRAKVDIMGEYICACGYFLDPRYCFSLNRIEITRWVVSRLASGIAVFMLNGGTAGGSTNIVVPLFETLRKQLTILFIIPPQGSTLLALRLTLISFQQSTPCF